MPLVILVLVQCQCNVMTITGGAIPLKEQWGTWWGHKTHGDRVLVVQFSCAFIMLIAWVKLGNEFVAVVGQRGGS